jgi:hypothetical protein
MKVMPSPTKSPVGVVVLQVCAARADKFPCKPVKADHHNSDSHKILYAIADKYPVKSEKNRGVVFALQV